MGIQEKINLNRKQFENSARINQFNENSNNSIDHEKAKFLLYMHLRKIGHNMIIEGKLKYGLGRPDLYDANEDTAYEIIVSESEKSKESKEKRYPFPVLFYTPEQIYKIVEMG